MNRYGRIEEQLVRHFQLWESRGRGWKRYPYPVVLEPPFQPFEGHIVFTDPARDDGRKPGLLGMLLQGSVAPPSEVQPSLEELCEMLAGPDPDVADVDQPRCELLVLLPEKVELSPALFEQLLVSLWLCRGPLSFELIGSRGEVFLQLSCDDADEDLVRQQLQAIAPEAILIRREDVLLSAVLEPAAQDSFVVEFGLASEFMRPLRSIRTLPRDPLSAIVSSLAAIDSKETALLQVVFQQTKEPWSTSIMQAVRDGEGQPFFATGPELVHLAEQKVSKPLFAAVVRLAAHTRSRERSLDVLRHLSSPLRQFADPRSNELIPLENEPEYDEEQHTGALIYRCCHRPGMLLNVEELASLVHLPAGAITHPKFLRLTQNTRPAPLAAQGNSLLLGLNLHHGDEVEVSLSPEQRMRHTYIVGVSGTGKSSLLLRMIMQDIEEGRGVAVLDPHGDLVDEICRRMPDHRLSDVVLLDPAATDFPIGLNILSAHSETERMLLSSDLVGVFRRLSTSWGDQMNSVLANAIQAFLESTEGGSIADLRRFLVDPSFRARFLTTVGDPEVVFYWQKEFPLLKGHPQAPILTRLDTFLRPRLVRNLVAQRTSGLDFRQLLDSQGIFLGKLAQGTIGEENSYLLGALLVAKFNQAALSRQELLARTRQDFHLYLDEFQHFVTPSVASLLTGVRKYRLSLTLAHQDLSQLSGRDSQVAAAALSAHTRIIFRVSDQDARSLATGCSHFEAADLMNLGIGQAVVRLERADADFNLRTIPLPPVDEAEGEKRKEEVVCLSRYNFGTPKEDLVSTVPEPESVARSAEPVSKHQADAARKPPTAPVVEQARTDVRPRSARTPGRGGPQHTYLQTLIRKLGQDRGFKATLEQQLAAGGAVDVALEAAGLRIACEISISTGTEHEEGNIAKCLEAGFDHVLWISAGKGLARMRARVKQLPPDQQARVSCLEAEEIVSRLDALAAEIAPTTSTVRGYAVSVQRSAPADETARTAVARAITDSLKRLRGRES